MAASRLRLQIGQGESDRRARTPAALPDGVCECWTLAATPTDQWLAAVHLLTVACDGDHDRRFGHFLSEPRGDLIPVQTGQAKIEQHLTRLLTLSNFDAISGYVDLAGQLFELAWHRLGRVAIVIDGAIEPAIRSSKPGKCHVDQIERGPLASRSIRPKRVRLLRILTTQGGSGRAKPRRIDFASAHE
jgi:hypothetical protein